MPIPETFVEQLLSAIDIADLVAEYVTPGKKSGRNFKALCPFHSEKTPSFSVDANKQFYYCFGCQKGGNAINFIREIENVGYRDAVEILSNKAGLTIPEDDSDNAQAVRRKRIFEVNRDAAKHFFEMLKSPLGESAQKYIASRGISIQSVKKFGLGAAPNDWTLLLDAMTKKGYTKQELIDAGLIRRNEKGNHYDFFRNRLMFPVIDVRDNVIAFSGRLLDSSDKGGKYVNSPDTPVFTKSRSVFAMNFAKTSKRGNILLVEGNIDVVMLHQAGFDNAVAPLGTAFTEAQARVISKYTDTVMIAFDSDQAGKNATFRAIPILEKSGVDTRVVPLTGASDPDEYIRKHGVDKFGILLSHSENHIMYKLLAIESECDLQTGEGRIEYLRRAVDVISEISTHTECEIYAHKVSEVAKVSIDSVNNDINIIRKAKMKKREAGFEKSVIREISGNKAARNAVKYDNRKSALSEEGVIRCLIFDQTLIKQIEAMDFSKDEFTSDFLRQVYEKVIEQIQNGKTVSEREILNHFDSIEQSHLTKILNDFENKAYVKENLCNYIERIRECRAYSKTASIENLDEIRKIGK